MLRRTAGFVANLVLSKVVAGALILAVAISAVYALSFGTAFLKILGLPHEVAGSVATVAVVAVFLYGMYLFATRAVNR